MAIAIAVRNDRFGVDFRMAVIFRERDQAVMRLSGSRVDPAYVGSWVVFGMAALVEMDHLAAEIASMRTAV